MKKAKWTPHLRWNQGSGPGARRRSPGLGVRTSDLALGVGDALDQVVAALVGRVWRSGILDFDVELVGPRKCTAGKPMNRPRRYRTPDPRFSAESGTSPPGAQPSLIASLFHTEV